MKYAVVLTVIVLLAGFAGCSALGPYRKVTVMLPQESAWEAVGRDAPWYELQWPNRHGEPTTFHAAKGVREVVLFIEKGADIPIAALPYGRGPGAGGWAAAYHGDSNVVLYWKYGELVNFLIELWEREPERLRVLHAAYWAERWDGELQNMTEMHSPGVIRMNREEFVTGLLTKQFHSIRMEALPTAPVPISNFPHGKWYYLHNPAYCFDAEPSIECVVHLSYPGSYTFFHEGSDSAVTVLLDAQGAWHLHHEQQGTFSRAGDFKIDAVNNPMRITY